MSAVTFTLTFVGAPLALAGMAKAHRYKRTFFYLALHGVPGSDPTGYPD